MSIQKLQKDWVKKCENTEPENGNDWVKKYVAQKQPQDVFYKKIVFKNFAIFTGHIWVAVSF